jgi:hypothetical protein
MGGIGGSGGFAHGGSVGSAVNRKEMDRERESPMEDRAEGGREERTGFAKGGSVKGDTKPRHKAMGPFK